jgi:glycosyltransferase involved in cell wall biosynthesis
MPSCALLIPCKNGEKFLPRLFATVMAQSRPFDEIWLFDDASTDRSGELARSFGAKVIRSDVSVGPAEGRNEMARATRCEWLHFHDADDTLAPRYLELVLAAGQHSGRDIVVCDMTWVREEDGVLDNRWTYDQAQLDQQPVAYMIHNTVGGINGLYNRQRFLAVNGFDPRLRFWEDMDLNIRLFQEGAKAAVVNEDLVTAYRRGSSYSNSNLDEVWRVKNAIMARLVPGADDYLLGVIVREAEIIAYRAADRGNWNDVRSSLALARNAGGDPPATHSGALKLVKRLLPDYWAFRMQYHIRRPGASAG